MTPRILVIDDSEPLRRAVRAVLAETLPGAFVGEAAGALPGLALVSDEPWDAVLLDLSLPDRGGVETLRDLRRLRPDLPVVVMSLHPEAEYGDAVRAAGAAGYVAKGSDASVLASAVRGVLRDARALAPKADVAAVLGRPAELDRDEERRLLARALHDDVGQTLIAAKLDLQLAATATDAHEARRRTADAARLLDEAVASVRALSAGLRPALLDELGLLAATRAWLARTHTRADVTLAPEGELPRAPPADEIAAFRAVERLVCARETREPARLAWRHAGDVLTLALGGVEARVPYRGVVAASEVR